MRLCGIVAIFLVAACAPIGYGDVIQYEATFSILGDQPTGPPAWLRLTFDDGGTAGSVNLRLEAVGLTGSEFLSKLYLNLDPVMDPTGLAISGVTKLGQFDDPILYPGADAWAAAGTGAYDMWIKFASNPAGGGIHRFGATETAVLALTGPPALSAASFDFSSGGGINGSFPFAAQIKGINGVDDGWITESASVIPEPITIGLLSLGGLTLLRKRRPT